MEQDLSTLSPSLSKDAAGIWSTATPDRSVSYPEDAHGECFDLEDRSFWFGHYGAGGKARHRASQIIG